MKVRTILPGLIDSHFHAARTEAFKLEVNAVECQKSQILEKVAAVKKTFPGEWIVDRGWIKRRADR